MILTESTNESVVTTWRMKEKKGEREKEKRRTRGTEVLESTCPETDLRNPSQNTNTQNWWKSWDSVIVSSVTCTWRRKEFC